MHPILRRLLFLSIFLSALAWTFLTRPAAGSTTLGLVPVPQVGFLAPDFSLTDLAGQPLKLSDLRGQVVLLNFWASWCLPCRSEMPALQSVYQTYREQGLLVLAVNASYQDAPTAMQTFLASFQHSYTILKDSQGLVNRLYDVNSLPTTFFIGRDGTIRDMVIGGPLSVAGFSSRLEPLLGKAPK